MRLDLPESLPLTCPACARQSERGVELSSLRVESRSLVEGDELIDGTLRCTGCARAYPVASGIPAIWRDLSGVAEALRERLLPPELTALLAEAGSDESPVAHEAALLGSYLDSSWGDRAVPLPEGPGGQLGMAALAHKVAERALVPVGRALEIGCGVGRGLAHLARGAETCVGLDAGLSSLRCARQILSGAELSYARRTAGRSYGAAQIRSGQLAAPRVQLLCADALHPPLAPGSFDRVAALNLLDSVRSPRLLLDVLCGLLAPGGELLLCSPYAWKSGVTDEAERLGLADPAAAVRVELVQRGLTIEDEDLHVPWLLRRDARAASFYDVHWLRARKAS